MGKIIRLKFFKTDTALKGALKPAVNALIVPENFDCGLHWSDITEQEGWYHRCEFKEHYRANINIPVRYSDPGSIANIRQVLAYMTKIQQKQGLPLFGCNEVPERPATGRPRKTDF